MDWKKHWTEKKVGWKFISEQIVRLVYYGSRVNSKLGIKTRAGSGHKIITPQFLSPHHTFISYSDLWTSLHSNQMSCMLLFIALYGFFLSFSKAPLPLNLRFQCGWVIPCFYYHVVVVSAYMATCSIIPSNQELFHHLSPIYFWWHFFRPSR